MLWPVQAPAAQRPSASPAPVERQSVRAFHSSSTDARPKRAATRGIPILQLCPPFALTISPPLSTQFCLAVSLSTAASSLRPLSPLLHTPADRPLTIAIVNMRFSAIAFVAVLSSVAAARKLSARQLGSLPTCAVCLFSLASVELILQSRQYAPVDDHGRAT